MASPLVRRQRLAVELAALSPRDSGAFLREVADQQRPAGSGMMNTPVEFEQWRKSSFANGGDNCVEAAFSADGRVGLRDSKDRSLAPHVFSSEEWRAFLAGVRNGEFNEHADAGPYVEAADPLMPAAQRFPVNLGARPLSDEGPSAARPFILRGVVARRVQLPDDPVRAKHRTTAHDTLHARTCNEDGKMIDDSYTTPDD